MAPWRSDESAYRTISLTELDVVDILSIWIRLTTKNIVFLNLTRSTYLNSSLASLVPCIGKRLEWSPKKNRPNVQTGLMVGLLRAGLPTSTIPYGKPTILEDRVSGFCVVDASGIWRYLSFLFLVFLFFFPFLFCCWSYPFLHSNRTGHFVGRGLDCIQLRKLNEGQMINLQGIIIINFL